MWIRKKEVEQLSEFVKGYISGEELDIRDNREGAFPVLKNDIYSLVNKKNEQIKVIESERDILSDYMADISHQLKTPITSMMIMADLLEDAEPEKQAEFIHNIRFSLNKMEWLIGALLKMAKLDAHVIDFVKKMFSLTFQQAIERINDDFCLGLDIGRTMTDRERREAARAEFERHKKVEKERRMRQEADQRYFDALNEWIRLDTQKREFRPLQGETRLHPKFLEALQYIGIAEYRLEQAEIERYINNVNK